MISTKFFYDKLIELEINFFTCVPDSLFGTLVPQTRDTIEYFSHKNEWVKALRSQMILW